MTGGFASKAEPEVAVPPPALLGFRRTGQRARRLPTVLVVLAADCSLDAGHPGKPAGRLSKLGEPRPRRIRGQRERKTGHVGIELFHWEYRPPLVDLPLLRSVRRKPVPNFGDEIGPMIVRAQLQRRGLPSAEESALDGRLFSVGSVLHFAVPGDHVWGTGINAKRTLDLLPKRELSIHAVRGPRTARKLAERGFEVPEVYGDPALLIREIDEINALDAQMKKRRLAVIPNFNDLPRFKGHPDLVSPLQDPVSVARTIAESEFVVGSSLHAMVFADALGVGSRLLGSEHEHPFKYEDYYLGSGRDVQRVAETVDEAIKLGPVDTIGFDPAPLLAAFPEELFVRTRPSADG